MYREKKRTQYAALDAQKKNRDTQAKRSAERRGAIAGAVGGAVTAPHRASRGVTAGKSALAAELLLGYGIVLIRVVGDFEIQQDGAVKGKIGHPQGQYGPFPIAIALTLAFFLLSFLARFGGAKATIANILGGIIVLTLAMKSNTEIMKVASVFTGIGKIAVPSPTGNESSGASNTNTTASATSSSPAATGTGTGTASATTPITNSSGAGVRAAHQAESDIANFGSQLGSGDPNPITTTQDLLGVVPNILKSAEDFANAATDSGNTGIEKVWDWLKSINPF